MMVYYRRSLCDILAPKWQHLAMQTIIHVDSINIGGEAQITQPLPNQEHLVAGCVANQHTLYYLVQLFIGHGLDGPPPHPTS